MKRSTKAVLLSAFVFPGVGHLYLRQFVIGIVLSGGSAGALYYIISSAVSKALEIAETIQSEGVPLDVEVIVSLVTEQSHGAGSISLSIASIALVAFWVIGIVDLYRVGRVLEKVDVAPLDKKT
ncbi:MAG: hypothetical protein WBN81_03535 [Gammaproteobacteria bacterium]